MAMFNSYVGYVSLPEATPCSALFGPMYTNGKKKKKLDLRGSGLTLNRLKKPSCFSSPKSLTVEQSWNDPDPATPLHNFPHTTFRKLHCRMISELSKKWSQKWSKKIPRWSDEHLQLMSSQMLIQHHSHFAKGASEPRWLRFPSSHHFAVKKKRGRSPAVFPIA